MGQSTEPDDPAEVVDFHAYRQASGGPYPVPCPRCGKPTPMETLRCLNCGLFFSGPAMQFAARSALHPTGPAKQKVRVKRLLVILLLAVAIVLLAIALSP